MALSDEENAEWPSFCGSRWRNFHTSWIWGLHQASLSVRAELNKNSPLWNQFCPTIQQICCRWLLAWKFPRLLVRIPRGSTGFRSFAQHNPQTAAFPRKTAHAHLGIPARASRQVMRRSPPASLLALTNQPNLGLTTLHGRTST